MENGGIWTWTTLRKGTKSHLQHSPEQLFFHHDYDEPQWERSTWLWMQRFLLLTPTIQMSNPELERSLIQYESPGYLESKCHEPFQGVGIYRTPHLKLEYMPKGLVAKHPFEWSLPYREVHHILIIKMIPMRSWPTNTTFHKGQKPMVMVIVVSLEAPLGLTQFDDFCEPELGCCDFNTLLS